MVFATLKYKILQNKCGKTLYLEIPILGTIKANIDKFLRICVIREVILSIQCHMMVLGK